MRVRGGKTKHTKPKRKLKNMPFNERGEALPKFRKCSQSLACCFSTLERTTLHARLLFRHYYINKQRKPENVCGLMS